MRVVILTQYYPPDKPGRIVDEVSNELRGRGHEVRILTTFPHYDHGKLPPGVRQRLRHVEKRDGFLVRRVPIYARHSGNALARVLNYLSFAASARFASSFVRGADVVYVHGTPATVAAPAAVWAKSMRVPFVFHVQDIWPESVTGSGLLPGSVRRPADWIINRWLRVVYRRAAAVISIAPTALEMLESRGVPAEKLHLVYNWARTVQDKPMATERDTSALTLLYAGNLGRVQDLASIIRATEQFRARDGFELRIVGDGVEREALSQLVSDMKLEDTVTFVGRLSPDDVLSEYAKADFQIVSLKNLEIFRGTIPSKFQAGLASGVPVITTVSGDVTEIVETHKLGFTAAPEDVESISEAMRRASQSTLAERAEFSKRARSYYDSNLSRRAATDAIERILKSAVEDAPRT